MIASSPLSQLYYAECSHIYICIWTVLCVWGVCVCVLPIYMSASIYYYYYIPFLGVCGVCGGMGVYGGGGGGGGGGGRVFSPHTPTTHTKYSYKIFAGAVPDEHWVCACVVVRVLHFVKLVSAWSAQPSNWSALSSAKSASTACCAHRGVKNCAKRTVRLKKTALKRAAVHAL